MNWKVAAAACAALAAFLGWRLALELRQPPSPPPAAIRLQVPPLAGTTLGAGDEPVDAVIGPSSDEIIFVATTSGQAQLWRRGLANEAAAPMAGTEGARWPAWIEPGRTLSFFTGGSLKRLDLATGAVLQVVAIQGAAGAAWPGDGSVVLGHLRGPLERWLDGRSTRVTTLQAGDIGHRFPQVVDAESWVYLAERHDGRRVIRLARNGVERDLADADGDARLVDGWLLYPRGGALLAQRFDVAGGRTAGRSGAIVTGVGVSTTGRTRAALSTRVALFAPPGDRRVIVRQFDADGTPGEAWSEPGAYWQVRVAPDGRAIAITMLEPLLATLDVYMLRKTSGSPEPVSLGLAADTDPVWSPDGATLLFRSVRSGSAELFTRRVGVTGAPEEPVRRDGTPVSGAPSDWIGDGTMLFTTPATPGSNTDVMRLSLEPGPATPVTETAFNQSDARVSPDAHVVAYVSDESGQQDVYVAGWPQGPRVRVSHAGGSHPRWSTNALYFLRDNREILRADRQPGPALAFSVPYSLVRLAEVRDFDTSARTGRFVAIVPEADAAPVSIGALVDWQSTFVATP